MKMGMTALSAYQVAGLRIFSAALVLLPFAYKSFKNIAAEKRGVVILSGLLGSFIPAFLYCLAETRIDSSLAAIFNSLTPLFAIIVGALFFQLQTNAQKIAGVIIGFIGMLLLPFANEKGINFTDVSYSLLVLLATIMYACNVNIVGRYLQGQSSLHIAAFSFSFLLLPALVILIVSGYFQLPLLQHEYLLASSAATVLGIFGTAIATVLFYMLVKNAGVLFASLVTYGIPLVAVILGILYGEKITLLEIGCLAIILGGVYLVNRKK